MEVNRTYKRETNLIREIPIADTNVIDEGKREVELSFSSETPYRRFWGIEILDHSEGAVDLTRINDIGVLLFNHDVNKVIGKVITAAVENNRGTARVRFDEDEVSEAVYKKVISGTLRTVSVGYTVSEWEDVGKGKTSKDGRFKGEVSVARKWTPLEISIVSVPADPTVGVGRSFENKEDCMKDYECRLNLNYNILRRQRKR